MSTCFLIFSVAVGIAEFVICKYLVETRNKTDSEIDALFENEEHPISNDSITYDINETLYSSANSSEVKKWINNHGIYHLI